MNLSSDEFEMIINGIDTLKRKCVNSLRVANDRIERANAIEAKIKAGDKYYIQYYKYRQHRFYKPETIRKKNLEIAACNDLFRKLRDYYRRAVDTKRSDYYRRAVDTKRSDGKGLNLSWQKDCAGKIIDPDL